MSDHTLPDVEPADPIEMTADPAMMARVRRLALVSFIALGAIFYLAVATLETHPAIRIALAVGWILMPSLLVLSLHRPVLRYLLVMPSALISIALLATLLWALPDDGVLQTGWLLVTTGVFLGGLLGVWFWFRLIPVPAGLDDPFSTGRWALIGIHVAMIVIGLALIAAGAVY